MHRVVIFLPISIEEIYIFLTFKSLSLFVSMEEETIKIMNQDLVRLDRFDGSNFTRWQDKVRFLLTTLKIAYILESSLAPLAEPSDKDTPEEVEKRRKRE